MSGSDDSSSISSAVSCAVCRQDLSLLSVAMRNAHSESCLDVEVVPQQKHRFADIGDRPSFDASVLDRLPDCPVCASVWPLSSRQSRATHVSECAKRFSVSNKDLADLISIFRESIESMSETSTSASGGPEKQRASASIRDSNTERFIKAFTPPPKKAPAQQAKRSRSAKGKDKDVVLGKSTTTKPKKTGSALQMCISDSVGKIQQSESAVSAAGTASCPKPSQQLSRSSSSMCFEIPEDDDFQSTKVRVSLQQTRIAIGKKRRLRQDVLDELDDDLNEAKALSLSLKRGPEKLTGKSAQKRRDAGPRSADALASSDILSSKDAQSFIRHRALELERIDGEIFDRVPCTAPRLLSLDEGAGTCSGALHADLEGKAQLWNLASFKTESVGDSRLTYCPMFQNYKMEHWRHGSAEECLSHVLDHILHSLAQADPDNKNSSNGIDESSLRSGYMALVKAARECFIRKCSALRCADWLEDVESIDVDKSEAVNENEAATPIVLSSSSSQSSAMASKEALRCSAKLESTNSLDSYSKDAVHREVSSAGPGTRKQTIGACPSYAKMAVDDLKRVASEFGLRTNTPRRLIEHQLKTIWEQTHRKPVSEDCAHVRSGGDVPSQNVPEALATQLRDYIRSQPAIYEPILCYRVLDFESTYAQISAAIPCKKAMLRRFFDSEGIVYTSLNN